MGQWLAHDAEIFSECVAFDQELAVPLGALLRCEHTQHGIVRPTVGRQPNPLHSAPEESPKIGYCSRVQRGRPRDGYEILFRTFCAASSCALNAGATFVTRSFTSAFWSAGRSVVVTASMTALW